MKMLKSGHPHAFSMSSQIKFYKTFKMFGSKKIKDVG